MSHLVIVGPGTLGLSLARYACERGFDVRLVGHDHAHAERGIQKIRAHWQGALEKGSLDFETCQIQTERLMASKGLEAALKGACALVEALPEDLATKAAFWRAAAVVCPSSVLPLTGSSSLSASLIRKEAKLDFGLQNFHLFVPIHRHPLVELASPQDTPDAHISAALKLAADLHLQVVPIRESLGLAASRMGLVQGLEAMRLLQEGLATAQDLDALMTQGYGHPCGPLELSDRIGLDLRLAVARHLYESTGSPAFEPPAILKEKVAKGELGRKSGKGFYPWTPSGIKT